LSLLQMALKKKCRRVMACLTLLGKMSWIAMNNNCCIKMWQSWDFKLSNFITFSCIRLLIFEEYPYGTLTQHKHWQKLVFSFLDKVWHAEGKYFFLALDLCCSWSRIPISARSWWITILCLALNVKKHVDDTITHIFLQMYKINTISNI